MSSNKLMHWQVITIGLIIYDMLAVNASYFLALWLRFDCRFSMIEPQYLEAFFAFAPIYVFNKFNLLVSIISVFIIMQQKKPSNRTKSV